MPRRFSAPPITRKTAEAYDNLKQKVREFNYTEIEEIRDGRTGLAGVTPLFEIIGITAH